MAQFYETISIDSGLVPKPLVLFPRPLPYEELKSKLLKNGRSFPLQGAGLTVRKFEFADVLLFLLGRKSYNKEQKESLLEH